MPKILLVDLVDNDKEKIKQVLAIAHAAGLVQGCVEVAYTAYDARQALRRNVYDLLVLDIALPDRADLDTNSDAGIHLMRELSERPGYNRPRQIVGLTAFPDALERAGPLFEQQLWAVIQYDAAGLEWRRQLERKIRYVMLADGNKASIEYACDLCVITALHASEYLAVMDVDWDWHSLQPDNEICFIPLLLGRLSDINNRLPLSGHPRKILLTVREQPKRVY